MKITLFAACLKLVGLSHEEAAQYLGSRKDTVSSWANGRRQVPDGIWDDLRALYSMQAEAAMEAVDMAQGADEISLNANGPRGAEWPSKGAHMAVLAMVALYPDCPPIAKDDSN